LAKWPAYAAAPDEAIVFGDTIKVEPKVNKTTLDFFDRVAAAQSAGASGGGN